MAYGNVNVPGITLAELEAAKAELQQAIDTLRRKVAEIEEDSGNEYDDSALKKAISDLENLVGTVAVSEQISKALEAALKLNGSEKYALASALDEAVKKINDDKADATHKHSAMDITDGVLSVERGGTGNVNGTTPKALGDSAGNTIISTYLKDVSLEVDKLTLTYGDGHKQEKTLHSIQTGKGTIGPMSSTGESSVRVVFDAEFSDVPTVVVSGYFTNSNDNIRHAGGVFYVTYVDKQGFTVTGLRDDDRDSSLNYGHFNWIAIGTGGGSNDTE